MQGQRNQGQRQQGQSIKTKSGQYNFNKFVSRQFIPQYFQKKLWRRIGHSMMNTSSVIRKQDPDRIKFSQIFKTMTKNLNPAALGLDQKQSRAIGTFLGLGICDALGASTQFISYDKTRKIITQGFEDIKKLIKQGILDARAGRIGIWTDDCSMALSMADSLIINNYQFIPIHIRYMFILWLEHGLNNGGRQYSIGLGGNISISMNQFMNKQQDFAIQGDKFNNGNGALMRLAPVPICFSDNQENAMKFSEFSSRTTHNGDQSKQCSRLLALIIVRLINRKKQEEWKECIQIACIDFKTDVKTVKCLAMSQQQSDQLYQQQLQAYQSKFKRFNKKIQDRNWNWKSEQYTYSQTRANAQPGYVGSYCMDALSMALHTIWYGKSFFDIALKNANLGGDCDTVGAIAGQIAGAIYGVDKYMLKLYSQMVDFKEERYQIFLKAYKLYKNANKKKQTKIQKSK